MYSFKTEFMFEKYLKDLPDAPKYIVCPAVFFMSANKRVFKAATFIVEDNTSWAIKSSP